MSHRFANRRDFAVIDEDGLIFNRRRAGSVDDADVDQRDDGIVHRDEGLSAGVKSRLSEGGRGEEECEGAHGCHAT